VKKVAQLEDLVESLEAEASITDNEIEFPLTRKIDEGFKAQNIIRAREAEIRAVIEHIQQSYCIT
jgi:DNA recombination-dependent growth factor C